MFLPLSTSLREEALALTFSHPSSPVTDHRFSPLRGNALILLLLSIITRYPSPLTASRPARERFCFLLIRDLGTIRSRAQALVKSGEWKNKRTREVEIAGIVGG